MTSGLRKILVGDAWYFSDPDLTYYSPTNEDDTAAKFGWRKLSGEGPAEIWTSNDNDNVTRNEACIMERGMSPSADCRISDI
jgi:hypothetical protein